MGKVKKLAPLKIRKLAGGRDPQRVIEEFILKLGHEPDKCAKEHTGDIGRWLLPVAPDKELEILADGLRKSGDATLYLGIDIVNVPMRNANEMLVAALQLADGLIGIKLSLVGHYLVLSATITAYDISVDELEFYYTLITEQQPWFCMALAEELGLESLPAE